jgi:hypothetical protein
VRGGAGAVNFTWNDSGMHIRWVKWSYEMCTEEMLVTGSCVPFLDESGVLVTLGYVITLLIFLPMALLDLKVGE